MPLPAPNLDDRRFQELVDDAKRLVQRRCPEWTDHNVSDPGVTLIETFAYLTDQLLYRLNRVPDRLHTTFLDLIGLKMLPPTPARVPLTFWLSAPARSTLTIAAGTRAGTPRSAAVESVVFATLDELSIPPCSLALVRTADEAAPEAEQLNASVDRTRELGSGRPFPAFRGRPRVGDALLLGLSTPVPKCAVRLDFRGSVRGV